MTARQILIKKWEESGLRKSVDTDFVEKVVYPAMEEYAQQSSTDERFLLRLVDTVWMESKESEEVPSTVWAKEMIEKTKR